MERFSTDVFCGNKASQWREVLHRVHWPVDFHAPNARAFDAELKVADLGPLSLRHNIIPAVVAERREDHVSNLGEQHFLLALHTRGRLILSHNGQQTDLGAGDFVLTDATAPATLNFAEPTGSLALRIPGNVLRSYMIDPERLCGLPMRGSDGFAHVLKEMLLSVWHQAEGGLPEAFEATLARNLLDVLATAYAMGHAAEIEDASMAATRLTVAKRYIERHLGDSELTPAAVAEACGISTRYLRKLFAAHDESVSGFILRRRLEETARQLANELWLNCSITDIAYNSGFGSSAHFARAFRRHFGITPSEYRGRHLSLMKAE